MSLLLQFLEHDGRPVHKLTGYFKAYENHFSRFRDREVTMYEIGCGKGGSLQMWKKWLGPRARIIGVDIKPHCKSFEEEQIYVAIGSQADPKFLRDLHAKFGTPDIVLDDGSHQMAHMRATFDVLYPLTSPTGVYAVEDLHTCYWPNYGGGYKTEGTFIEFCKDKMDEINAPKSRGALSTTPFTRSTASMHVYESIVVFERAPYQKSESLVKGRE